MAKENPERAERLAAALRDNLKRRKAQTRERNPETPRERDDPAAISPPEGPSRA